MGKVLAALAAIKEIIAGIRELVAFFKRIKARNDYKRNQDAQKDIEKAKQSGDAAELGDAIRRL